jgi:hypothetical protein
VTLCCLFLFLLLSNIFCTGWHSSRRFFFISKFVRGGIPPVGFFIAFRTFFCTGWHSSRRLFYCFRTFFCTLFIVFFFLFLNLYGVEFLPSAFLSLFFFISNNCTGWIPPVSLLLLFLFTGRFIFIKIKKLTFFFFYLKQGLIKPHFQEVQNLESQNHQPTESVIIEQQEVNDQVNDQVSLRSLDSVIIERQDQQEINDPWCKCCNSSYCPCRKDSLNKKPGRGRRFYCCVCGKYKCNSSKYSNYKSPMGFFFDCNGKLKKNRKYRK